MTFLGILLVLISIVKLRIDTKLDWESIEENLENNPDLIGVDIHKVIYVARGIYALDYLLGIMCGLFIIFI